MKADINYHAETSKQGKILPLKRLTSQPYHYEDDSDTKGKLDLTNNKLLHSVATESYTNATEIAPVMEQDSVQFENEDHENGSTTEVMTEMDTEQLTEVEVIRITGRRLRKPPKGRKNPKKDKQRLKIFRQICFMSELQLQSLLDRTKPLDGEDEGMDMTTVNGERISKYDIRAMKVGSKVPNLYQRLEEGIIKASQLLAKF